MKTMYQNGNSYFANFETAFNYVISHVDCDTSRGGDKLLRYLSNNRIRLNACYQTYFRRQDWLFDFITLIYKNMTGVQLTKEEVSRLVLVYWCVGEDKDLSMEFNVDISYLNQ